MISFDDSMSRFSSFYSLVMWLSPERSDEKGRKEIKEN